ncbi:hypothetical protein FB446DRAFT_339154 [Lentinula raphanica]|nr:hypothetical protein FB446DRAFT_339154 [Lentinula raphanica]
MRYSTTTTTLILTAVNLLMGAAVIAQDVGELCPTDQAGFVGCGINPSVNDGRSYIFICNGEEFVLFADCGPGYGCEVTSYTTAVCLP